MCKLGLFDYMRQSGKVKLHGQGTLSDARYNELKNAQKMIKNFIKDSDCRVDIYDALSVPEDKFVYTQRPDSVYVEFTDLLSDSVKAEEFYDKAGNEPFIRQIYRFIDKSFGVDEEPIDKMKRAARNKFVKVVRKQEIPMQRLEIFY